jgi:hypothetical protein
MLISRVPILAAVAVFGETSHSSVAVFVQPEDHCHFHYPSIMICLSRASNLWFARLNFIRTRPRRHLLFERLHRLAPRAGRLLTVLDGQDSLASAKPD